MISGRLGWLAAVVAAWGWAGCATTPKGDAGDVVLALQRHSAPAHWTNGMSVTAGGQRYRVTFAREDLGRAVVNPTRLDRFVRADGVKPKGVDTLVRMPGEGTPLVGIVEGERQEVRDRFHPKHGFFGAFTALLVTNGAADAGGRVPVTMHLVFTRNTNVLRTAGGSHRLAADLTAPLELCLEDNFLKKLAIRGLLNPRESLDNIGLFLMGPYDPRKVPVVFVHGLNSDPHIWKNAMNTILADPELRSRYMLWFFQYPTGLPVPGSAQRLRWELEKVRGFYDPEGDDPGFNRMVLVGHSMGGLVSRFQVIDSADDFWNMYFKRPPERLILTSKSRKVLVDALRFKRQPFVSRTIFVAVPHRGSKVADIPIVGWATRLIRLPFRTLEIASELARFNTDSINPELMQYRGLGLSSVDMLKPGHPYFKALEKRPILVPHHSIIGDRGRGDTPNSSDGIVPYWSSHLATAQSERIIPAPHGCTERSETCQEIARVLREAAGLPPRPVAR